MGATLPLIMRHFVHSSEGVGGRAAFFYAVNTLGTVAGTLVAGFVLLPYFGMTLSNSLVAAVNLAIGLSCVALGREAIPFREQTQSDANLANGASRSNRPAWGDLAPFRLHLT